ncbi:hypothetical protein ACFWUU_40415 [Kribbella sp. NPDC058693]|uniref:hypothetical protein n=1 Tax=Kribbella sp. NPDC058693 TaxID=3346602 RepID=UPI003653C432
MNSGDRVNALYFSQTSGTCLAMNRRVLSVAPRGDGRLDITVDLPDDAQPGSHLYTVNAQGESDYVLGSAGFYLQCGLCDGDVFVPEDQWDDPSVHLVPHEDCPNGWDLEHDGSGADLDHARRHADVD